MDFWYRDEDEYLYNFSKKQELNVGISFYTWNWILDDDYNKVILRPDCDEKYVDDYEKHRRLVIKNKIECFSTESFNDDGSCIISSRSRNRSDPLPSTQDIDEYLQFGFDLPSWLKQNLQSIKVKTFKKELMEVAWHPRRVTKWIDAGFDIDNL